MTQYTKSPTDDANVMIGKSMIDGMVPTADDATFRHATATAMRRIISSVARKQSTVSAISAYVMYSTLFW
jgi:hypothetical protein